MEKKIVLHFLMVAFILLTRSYYAFSYPQNIAQGYSSCGTCHMSPDGGGRANAYGHLSLEAFIPDKKDVISWMSGYREHKENKAIMGYDEEMKPKFQYEIGGNMRTLLLYSNPIEPKDKTSFDLIPMLFEAQFVLLRGKFSFYGAFNPLFEKDFSKPLETSKKIKPFSREHWLMYNFSEGLYLRAGRMDLPFGLKSVDHTRATKQVLELEQQDQYYGLMLDYVSNRWALHFMPYMGNYLKQKRSEADNEEKGGVLTVKAMVPTKIVLGFSSLLKKNKQDLLEKDHSFFVQAKLPRTSYVIGELVHKLVYDKNDGKNNQHTYADFIRLGKYFSEWLDLYLEYSERRTKSFKNTLQSVRLGTKGRFFPWLEIEPFVQYKHDKPTSNFNLKKIWVALQIHAFY